MFKKKRALIEIPHEWNRELVESFFQNTRNLQDRPSVEKTIYISGIKRFINSDEITLKAYGHTPLPANNRTNLSNYIQALIAISFYKDSTTKPTYYGNASLNTYFCHQASDARRKIEVEKRKKQKVTESTRIEFMEFKDDTATLDVQLTLPSHFEKLFEENFLYHKLSEKMPSLIIRLTLPQNFDTAQIDPTKAWESHFEIERFWLESILVFNPTSLAKSFLFQNDF